MKLKAEGNMLGALILIFIVIIASGVIAGYIFLRGSQVESGASISITSAQATPLANGQTYLTVSLVNTGSPGYVSVSVYSGGSQVFSGASNPVFLNTGQSITLSYTMPVTLTAGQQITVVAVITTPSGSASSSLEVVVT